MNVVKKQEDFLEMPLQNAGEIIERFGGIRPMAKKIEVAVTTIQGWKKRDIIPALRRETILQAARTHGVDLSDLLSGAPSPPTPAIAAVQRGPKPVTVPLETPTTPLSTPQTSLTSVSSVPKTERTPLPPPARQMQGVPDRQIWILLALAFVILSAFIVLLWPRNTKTPDQDVATSQNTAPETDRPSSFLGTVLPEIPEIEKRAGAIGQSIGNAVTTAQELSGDILAQDSGTLEEHAQKLGQQMTALGQSPALADMLQRLNMWQNTGNGLTQEAFSELGALLDGFNSAHGALETQLESARAQSTVLGQAFEGVPTNDLKAAALLLGITQLRTTLDHDNTPFSEDLALLQKVVGPDNPELTSALERLAPQAEKGVLTPAGLANELKALTEEIVMASLNGENVSLTERTKAHMNTLFQVEKNGELITGTPVQATLSKAQKFLDSGDIDGAISTIRTLDGKAGRLAQPWLQQAQGALSAQKINALLSTVLKHSPATRKTLGAPQYIQNDETGINLYKPDSAMPVPKRITMPQKSDAYTAQ